VLIKSVVITMISKDRDNDHGSRVFPKFGNAAYAVEGYAIQRTPARKTPKIDACLVCTVGWGESSLREAREVAGSLHSSVIVVPAIIVVDILDLEF